MLPMMLSDPVPSAFDVTTIVGWPPCGGVRSGATCFEPDALGTRRRGPTTTSGRTVGRLHAAIQHTRRSSVALARRSGRACHRNIRLIEGDSRPTPRSVGLAGAEVGQCLPHVSRQGVIGRGITSRRPPLALPGEPMRSPHQVPARYARACPQWRCLRLARCG